MSLAFSLSLTNARPRWLYVDFNSYFASVEQQLNPALRGKPVAVVPVETDATCAIAASYEAKAFGVKTGTPVWEAKRMCPGIVCVLANHEKYVQFHEAIKVEVERHIHVSQVCSIDEVACELMNNEAPRAIEIAQAIKRGLAKNIGEYVRCSIGIAPNKYLAKVATDLQKPDGLTQLTLDDIPGRLLGLHLRDLPGIGYNMERRLRMAGIGTVAALMQMEAKRMRQVWGSLWGEKMYYLLRGVDIPDEETTRRTIGHSHVMAPDLRAPEQARYVARRLTLKAGARLRRMGYLTGGLSFGGRIENGPRWGGYIRCIPAQDNLTLLRMLELLWAEMLKENGRYMRLKKVSVTLQELVPADDKQDGLFDPLNQDFLSARKRADALSRAMDKINYKYGRDTLSLGLLPSQRRSFSGTKIAFTRIPDAEEFLE